MKKSAKNIQIVMCFLSFLIIANFLPKDSFGQEMVIGVKTVVIDAGHGGKDVGAIGANEIYEKNLVLKVALKLGKKIQENHKDVKVIYTRDSDEFIELHERAKIANKIKADLFISIHANSAENKAADGTETFVLGLHKSEAALDVAKRENSAILLENNYETSYSDFNPNDPDSYIGLSLRQSAYLDQSLSLASKIQNEFTTELKRRNRGVRQAGFLVLYKTTMPSILVEIGFVSNATEAKYLKSDKGQTDISSSIYKAFATYKKEIDAINKSVVTGGDLEEEVDSIGKEKEVLKSPKKEEEIDKSVLTFSGKTPKKEVVKKTNKVIFKVQLASSKNALPLSPENFNGLEGVSYYQTNGWYKYIVGNFEEFSKANEYKKEVRSKGYPDAFVIATKNGKRIDLNKVLNPTE